MDIGTADEIRFSTGMGELDRVLGGGAVKGSLVLVGGAPVKNKRICKEGPVFLAEEVDGL